MLNLALCSFSKGGKKGTFHYAVLEASISIKNDSLTSGEPKAKSLGKHLIFRTTNKYLK